MDMKIEDTNNRGVQNTYNKDKTTSGNIMAQAIKAYKDELLTGLTDEEREDMNKKISEYLKDKPVKTNADKLALNNFIKGLLRGYGFKGNIEEYSGAMGAEAINAAEQTTEENNSSTNSEPMIAYQKSVLSGAAIKTRVLG